MKTKTNNLFEICKGSNKIPELRKTDTFFKNAWISPNGDFDFNVVIRSMIYNKQKKYLSCSVGGAITILSDPEKEYEECLVKVKKLLDGMHDQ
jgi:nitroimidazol reductase NimA-like FMN-containing flavoprotein (pyridoxamine 5'-phosphate oxidase superfamily)